MGEERLTGIAMMNINWYIHLYAKHIIDFFVSNKQKNPFVL